MNPIIKKQLKECKVAKIPFFTDETTTLHVTKNNNDEESICLNEVYLIELCDESFINETSNVLLNRNGTCPKSKYLKCMPTNFDGDFIKIDAIGYNPIEQSDNKDVYMGYWIHKNYIEKLTKL